MTLVERVGEFRIAGELSVRRFGFGAMRLTGPGVWGPPNDVPEAQAVLRRVIELGINFIDTADVYGPGDNERLIRDTLAPFPASLVIGTKGGVRREGPATPDNPGIGVDNSAAHLRRAVEGSLRDLGLERIDLYQLHRVDPDVPIEETMGVLARLREEGKIRHVGLSEVDVDQIERARTVVEIATVQNAYNLADRKHEAVVDFCESRGIAFISFYPQRVGTLAGAEVLKAIAMREGVTPSLIALAWLFRRSPAIVAIPGTSSMKHLNENVAAGGVRLSSDDVIALDSLATEPPTSAGNV
jgi:aryl-alcohol dehydrogenase-like predicted oxidoreductase